MRNDRLNEVVERLQSDPRFLRRFRRSPRWALRGYGLSRPEVEALKRGCAAELLEQGLDPSYVQPEVTELVSLQALALAKAKRLTPVATIAAATLALGAAAGAPAGAKRRVGAAGAKRRVVPTNVKNLRYLEGQRATGAGCRFSPCFVGKVAVNVGKANPPVKSKKRRKAIRRQGRRGRDVQIVHRVAGPNFDYGQARTNKRGIFRIPGPPVPPGTQTFRVDVEKKTWRPKKGRDVAFRKASRRMKGEF